MSAGELRTGERDGAEEQREFQTLLERCRPRLRQLVAARISPSLNARLDPSDVVQDALAKALSHRGQYQGSSDASFYAWLRGITLNRLVDLNRIHIEADRRSVLREVAFPALPLNDPSAVAMAKLLADSGFGPVGQVERHEEVRRLYEALQQLRPLDREVLTMRHLEQMTVEEIAAAMRISRTNVSTRHLRALQRLRQIMAQPHTR